jgi:hypothetical protein
VVDYYTEVPERPYLAGLTRENLLASLRTARPGLILFYGKGHSGTTAFKSRLGTEHPKLGDDPLKLIRRVTREAGVRFCVYYSGLVDGKAGQRHPEWLVHGAEGKAHRGGPPFFMSPICPASRYFEDWASVHLEEILTRYEPDMIWVDGDWAESGYCYCPRCQKLSAERFGEGAIRRPEYHLWIRNEFRRKFAGLIRKLRPGCLYSAGNTTPAVDAGLENHVDWQSGDWFRPDNNRIMQSLAMRRYTTLGLPYDAMTCDTQFIHGFSGARSRLKSLDCMLQEGAGVLANGGKWWYWTYPMPHGALIPSRMRQARACHEFADQRKDLWLGTESARWTACVDTGVRPIWLHGDTASLLGAAKSLLYAHRSPDLVHVNQLQDPIPYEMLVVANQGRLTRGHAALLEKFVRHGGLLLSTGVTARCPGMAELLGIKIVDTDALGEGHVILKDGTPVGIAASWDRVEPAGAETWWKLYESWGQYSRPPWMSLNYPIDGMLDEERPVEAARMPAVTARRLGRGLAVHVAADPLAEFWKWGHPTTWYFLRELLGRMQPAPWFRCGAPTCVEAVLRVRGGELLMHFVNVNPGQDTAETGATSLHVYDIPALASFPVEVRCPRRPDAVFLEPGHHRLAAEWRGNRLHFTLPSLAIHACVRIQPWDRA